MNLKEKKILVTGADGFIGSHLVERLIDEGCRVKAFVYYNSFNSWGWLDSFPPDKLKRIEIHIGDIRDQNKVRNAIQDTDIIFHLAALIAIPYSYYAPESYIDTNIKGTLNILQSARDANVERVLVTSTSEVYGTAQYVPIDEQHPRQPQSPYSASKIGADSISESFHRSFDMPITIVRPFNTYGPRQSARAVIPTVITQLLNGNIEIKLGDISPTRDFLYVQDTVDGFLQIAGSDDLIGHDVNIASQTEISIEQLVHEIIKQVNPKGKIVAESSRYRPEKSEVFRLFGSNEKIKKYTNWDVRYSLQDGIKETIEWFKNKKNLSFYKSAIYNL